MHFLRLPCASDGVYPICVAVSYVSNLKLEGSPFLPPSSQMSARGRRQKPTAPPKTVLIVGATGRQGRAVVSALFLRTNFRILALTRNVKAASSKALLSRNWSIEPVGALLELVQGDLDKPETIRKIFMAEGRKGAIAAVFVALAFPGLGANADGEERQGIVSYTLMFVVGGWLILFFFFFFFGL